MFGRQRAAKTRLHELQQAVTEQVQQVSGQLQEALQQMPLDKVAGKLDELKETAGTAAGEVVARATELAGRAGQAAVRAVEAARNEPTAPPELPALAQVAEQAGLPINSDSSSGMAVKLLWLLAGLAAGVLLGVLLAPTTGRRSRTLLKDKLRQAPGQAAEAGAAAASKVTDLGARARGVAHDLKERVQPGSAGDDDGQLVDRVRTQLGHHPEVKTLERLNIDSIDGVITLRGPVVDAATGQRLEKIVRGIKGVRDVRTELLVDSAALS